jgi:hypothetical protein
MTCAINTADGKRFARGVRPRLDRSFPCGIVPPRTMRTASLVLAALVGSVACGSRTGLDAPTPEAAGASNTGEDASCSLPNGPAPPTCTSWQAAGPDRLISESSDESTASPVIGSVIAVGCGVLVAWATSAYVNPGTSNLTWTTETVAFDGSATGAETAHPSLAVTSNYSGSIQVASSAGGLGLLAADQYNCRLLPLDFTGADNGSPTVLSGSSCIALESPGPGAFSYLVAAGGQGSTPTTLVTVDSSGGPISTLSLGDAPNNALWGRLRFADGSFMLNSFREDPSTSVYSGVLQHFDASGNALSPPFAQPIGAPPVLLAATPSGALASWYAVGAAAFAPVDFTGKVVGPVQTEPFVDAPYGVSLSPTPSGDVFVSILEDDVTDGDIWTIYVQERAPDGTPRAPLAALPRPGAEFDPGEVTPIVAADGIHALIVYENGGIHTLPLVCVD